MRRSLSVGIIDGAKEIFGCLQGVYFLKGVKPLSGPFSVESVGEKINLRMGKELIVSDQDLSFIAQNDSTFTLDRVFIGKGFHWQKSEKQVFSGNLLIKLRPDSLLCAVNQVDVEDYLKSVISSEMSPLAPIEFLKAHAIVSRSWLFARMTEKKNKQNPDSQKNEREILRTYDNKEHELFDICADDHCQRYHGLTRILSTEVEYAVSQTQGLVLMHGDSICDTRYSKCCGGITEEYSTAWEEKDVPYLVSISDSIYDYGRLNDEDDVEKWIKSKPSVFCNIEDKEVLPKILTDTDLKTEEFFRWKVELSRDEVEDLIIRKTGYNIGEIKTIKPISRGPSGRIKKLLIEGTSERIAIGKELEIRRVLSESHLLSSAFLISENRDKRGRLKSITLLGAGWGHGVGMCQIGAAHMALMGYSYDKILGHYFRGTRLVNIYEKEI